MQEDMHDDRQEGSELHDTQHSDEQENGSSFRLGIHLLEDLPHHPPGKLPLPIRTTHSKDPKDSCCNLYMLSMIHLGNNHMTMNHTLQIWVPQVPQANILEYYHTSRSDVYYYTQYTMSKRRNPPH